MLTQCEANFRAEETTMYKHTAADHLRKVDGLAGSLYMQNASLKRHRASPLVTEREQFLQYLLQRGISVGFVQRVVWLFICALSQSFSI